MRWFVKVVRSGKRDDSGNLPPGIWRENEVCPTLNAFDNNGDSRATVLIMRQREGKPGGGKGPMFSDKSFTLATNNDQTLFIIDGTRVNDVRVYDDGIVPTVTARYGTGGGNVPAIYPISGNMIGRADHNGPNGKGFGNETDSMFTLTSTDKHAVATDIEVRRLTPMECERLQGFPDNWTEGQADSSRYKQMGNAVAVPVASWIVERLVTFADGRNLEPFL